MTEEKKDLSREVTMTLTLEEWGNVRSAVFAMWEKSVKLDEKARKADFDVKELTAKVVKDLGDLMAKIDEVAV